MGKLLIKKKRYGIYASLGRTHHTRLHDNALREGYQFIEVLGYQGLYFFMGSTDTLRAREKGLKKGTLSIKDIFQLSQLPKVNHKN